MLIWMEKGRLGEKREKEGKEGRKVLLGEKNDGQKETKQGKWRYR